MLVLLTLSPNNEMASINHLRLFTLMTVIPVPSSTFFISLIFQTTIFNPAIMVSRAEPSEGWHRIWKLVLEKRPWLPDTSTRSRLRLRKTFPTTLNGDALKIYLKTGKSAEKDRKQEAA